MLRWFALVLVLFPAPASALCKLALVLALDISSSVNEREYAIQKGGLVAAFRDAAVREAILTPEGSGILVAMVEWSGYQQQDMMIDWRYLDSVGAIDGLVLDLERHQRPYAEFATALGKATEFAAKIHGNAPEPCARRVIDVSGDGANNDGVGPRYFADRGVFNGIVINGLSIFDDFTDPTYYYETNVIHGQGAFVERAYGFEAFPPAIRRKLLREINRPLVIGMNKAGP